MTDAILTRLFDQYAVEQSISVQQAEIDQFLENLHSGKEQAGLTSDENLTDEEATQVEEMETLMARAMIQQWKINKVVEQEAKTKKH